MAKATNQTTAKSQSACTKKAKDFLAKELGIDRKDVVKGVHFEVRESEFEKGVWKWNALGTQTPVAEVQQDTLATANTTEPEFDETCKREMCYTEAGDAIAKELHDQLKAQYSRTTCPECGVTLDNGVMQHGDDVNGKPNLHDKFEFYCMGCGKEFGNPIPKPTAPTIAPRVCGYTYTSTIKHLPKLQVQKVKMRTGAKIEKDRIEQNGVKRPSKGTVCAQLWEMFEAMYGENGCIPTPRPAKDRSALSGFDPVTTTVQLYKWREFMGFKGRK